MRPGRRCSTQPTRQAGHAADGDGTVNEVARGLAGSETVLGLMPRGSVMNVARTLWIPRDLPGAARTIAEGKVLAMDMGRVGDRFFLEAASVGLDAGLFGYFERLESGGRRFGVVQAALRFVRQLGNPRLIIEHEGGRLEARAPLVSVANGPYVSAAYAIAPAARIDDGLLDVVVFRGSSVLRGLIHLVFIAGERPLPLPAHAQTLRVRSVRIAKMRGRPLPVHADGESAGVTPASFEVAPGALRVIVGPPEETRSAPGKSWDPSAADMGGEPHL